VIDAEPDQIFPHLYRAASRGQRNTSCKAGKVALPEGGAIEARELQAAPGTVHGGADKRAVGTSRCW
jgi:hypothetical protein